ncbi:MAG TPA: carboxymuconolactone decarboxylase family protein [Pseudonocardiaceae bacterium]|nr:carboxymuconolactone decarboxylase family protein [Pseudonocardiaceae bacterium]
MSTPQRLSIRDVDPAAVEAVLGLERYVRAGDLEPRLLELLKVRASQLNGCAYCLDMHNRDARALGEGQRRLDVVAAWREAAGLFTDRERAALAFTEAVTRIGDVGVPDEVWAGLTHCFDDTEIVRLLLAVATINVWNRLAVSTHQDLPDIENAPAHREGDSG